LTKTTKKALKQVSENMAWTALISIIIATLLAFFVIPEKRLILLEDVITWFYFTMSSIIGIDSVKTFRTGKK
jgi:hypothetical protein